MDRRRGIAKGVLGIIVALAILAPGAGEVAQARHQHDSLPTLRLDTLAGNGNKLAVTLDPAQAGDETSQHIVQMVNAGLIKLLPDGTPAPDLATWTVSAGGQTYTFTIKTGARFSNGDPVTASDVTFSLQRALAPDTNSPLATTYLGAIQWANEYNQGKASSISGLQVIDARTVQIELVKPYAYFLSALSYPPGDVLDPAVVSGHAAGSTDNYLTDTCAANMGAGPFMFQCQNGSSGPNSFYPSGSGPSYTLVPNPDYVGTPPTIRVSIPATDTIDTAYQMYQSGQLDISPVPVANLSHRTIQTRRTTSTRCSTAAVPTTSAATAAPRSTSSSIRPTWSRTAAGAPISTCRPRRSRSTTAR